MYSYLKQIEWSKKCLDTLTSVEKLNEGKDDIEVLYNKAVQVFNILSQSSK